MANTSQAEKTVKNYIKISSSADPHIYCILGDAYRRSGEMNKAVENYHLAVSNADDKMDSVIYFTYLNFSYIQQNNNDGAAYYFDLAKNLNTSELNIHGTLAFLFSEINQPERALVEYDLSFRYNSAKIDKANGSAFREYMQYLIKKSKSVDDAKPYLLHAKSIGLSIPQNEIVVEYLKEIEELLTDE